MCDSSYDTSNCYSMQNSKELISSLPNSFKVVNFKKTLIGLSCINTEKLALLKELFTYISFKENATSRGKYQAIVAGSYPAFLGKAVKKFKDIDIFILWNVNGCINMRFSTLLHMLGDGCNIKEQKLIYSSLNGICTIVNIGKLQMIVKKYDHYCYCMYHIDSIFFRDFHHVTRWKLITFSSNDIKSEMKKDVILPKYIPFNEHMCVITENITIECNSEKSYPSKHLDNRLDLFPPKLFQQALHVLVKDKYKIII